MFFQKWLECLECLANCSIHSQSRDQDEGILYHPDDRREMIRANEFKASTLSP
jgi:hypothetical protein